jgi:hypothetical protein
MNYASSHQAGDPTRIGMEDAHSSILVYSISIRDAPDIEPMNKRSEASSGCHDPSV